MPTYKTPDVYVEEISLFPPSVAEVETAIPAFIGYTEIMDVVGASILNPVPIRIGSLLEYEQFFGKGPKPSISRVELDDASNFKSASIGNVFFLYDSVRLFYANGGGDCYVISVGSYASSIAVGDFNRGLSAVQKVDEPTLLLFPDAAVLSASDLYGTLQAAALEQCGTLRDRFAVLDLRSDDPLGTAFRNNLPMNNLKYGAAYTPWLTVSLPKNVHYGDVKGTIFKFGANTPLKSFTDNASVQGLIDNYDNLLTDETMISAAMNALFGTNNTFRRKFEGLVNDFQAHSDEVNFAKIPKLLFDFGNMIDDWAKPLPLTASSLRNSDLLNTVRTYITSSLAGFYTDLVSYDNEAKHVGDGAPGGDPDGISGYVSQFTAADYTATQWGVTFSTATASTLFTDADTEVQKMNRMLVEIKASFEKINGIFLQVMQAMSEEERSYESSLLDLHPVYKKIIAGINASSTIVPPSGAIVGVYASTDSTRGVWKAPANVGLNSVIAPAATFTATQLDALNIDVNAGKSINAIRAFAGKGTLVWGARTLAGNDNEWRYVSVRRFFNMVEESVKKSTYWAVFEPNDANTWVKVRGMIENYLTQKWREGALAGATTKEAFFVKCGLGTTMTSQNILEGMMNVEIGMAVVRPAEFIVLKFSHKLQTS
ncbi:MAG: putative phage tail sheath protein [Chlorobi bacterium]|nr:putative phage tail sheath protein [Chlorobiota bacterium]